MFESFIGVNFWTALFVLMNTLAVFFVAKKYLFVPVKNMIDSRQKEIDTMYEEADAAKAEAETLKAEYQEKLDTARQTSERIVKEAVARGQSREEEIISEANAKATLILEKTAADVVREKKKVMNDAKDEISALAMSIAEKVVGRELNDSDQVKLVDAFIEELGE